ncbi:MAG: class I SAM-dependent methyltransferase [Candidatus Paceibacteria bacterium]
MTQKAAAYPDPKSFYNHVMPDKYGSDYESARWRANAFLSAQYQMMVDVLTRLVTPNVRQARSILEVGPGPGTWTKILLGANAEADYTLVDISKEMLGQAREGLSDRTNVLFVESDLLAFESSKEFDFFFSSRAIEYMPDKRRVCAKISSLLAPGAHGAIITKMPKSFFDWLRGRSNSGLHGAQVGPRVLIGFMRENGLVVEKKRIATTTVPLLNSAFLNTAAYRLLKHVPLFFPLSLFAESYIVIFHKPV